MSCNRGLFIALIAALSSCAQEAITPLTAPNGEWISLFNGRDLDGWTPKIAGHETGDNRGATFRVENGVIKVAYDQYASFGQQFGSLFHRQKFSSYWLRAEYRFVGKPAPGAPEWAYRDSGIQLHSQSPDTMTLNQEFPVSVELNLIGGKVFGSRPTGNVCTNGALIRINGAVLSEKCAHTSNVTVRGDKWVTVLAEVREQAIKYAVNGVLVTTFEQPQLNHDDTDAQRLLAMGAAAALRDGYISLQSNGHPIEFRKIEVLPTEAAPR